MSDVDRVSRRIESALQAAHKAGFSGGVFDSHFCVWPSVNSGYVLAAEDFFRAVEDSGGMLLSTDMALDGGAGN
ncbi:MAG: hypothetical protein AAF098_13440 [Pseudomonadota bacterium]